MLTASTTASGYIVLALATAIGGGLVVILAVLVFELISEVVDSHVKAMGITFSIIATIVIAVSSVESIRTQFVTLLPEPARAVITDIEELVQPIIDGVENMISDLEDTLGDLLSNEGDDLPTPPPATVPSSPTAVPTTVPTAEPSATETLTPTATEVVCEIVATLNNTNGRVRSGHGREFSVIGAINNGETFQVIDVYPDTGRVEWYQIAFNGLSGWVHWSIVNLDPPNCV